MSAAAQSPTPRDFLTGAGFAMVTMTIWAGWNVVSRMGMTGALNAYDIAFLRALMSAMIAVPIFVRHFHTIRHRPRHLLALMVIGAGAPYVLVASQGFGYAPASHGVLIPGSMPLWVALLSVLWLGERFSPIRKLGYALIALTVAWRLFTHSNNMTYLIGDAYFIGAGVLWAFYTVANKQVGLAPLAAVSVVTVGSTVFYMLPYGILYHERIAGFPFGESLFQMIYQGVITAFLGLLCYNRAIHMIGASRASAFAATIPLLATLFGIPILGEMPRMEDWAFVILLSVGVLLATFERHRRTPPVSA